MNGIEVGDWPYGYRSFRSNITDAMNTYGENLPYASRWDHGAGIWACLQISAAISASVARARAVPSVASLDIAWASPHDYANAVRP